MPKRKSLSIKDIAKESGASLTTVSLVLNRRDQRISAATRERVMEAVNRLGYRPSRLAQALQARRSGLIAILVPKLHHAFADVYFGELISAIHDYASKAQYKVLLEVARPEFIRDDQHRELFDRAIVDGMLCIGTTSNDAYLNDFEDGQRPMVLVNNEVPGLRLNSVRCDYEQAGRLAGEYLVGLGHRHIGLIHGAPEVHTTWDLRAGFTHALREAGVALPPDSVVDGLFTEEGGEQAAIRLCNHASTRSAAGKLTAILAGNDKMAIGAIRGLKRCGCRVPQDVSVVGCDDIHQGEFADPPLTTIHTPIYDIGQESCRRLLELVEGTVDHVHEVRPVTLTVRESASAPGRKQA